MGAGKVNPSRLVAWGLVILAVIVAALLIINFWHALTDWTPWSDKSRRERAEATAATATATGKALDKVASETPVIRQDQEEKQRAVDAIEGSDARLPDGYGADLERVRRGAGQPDHPR